LQSRRRQLSIFCKNKGDRKQLAKNTSASIREQASQQKERKGIVYTSSSSRHLVQPISHSLFSLEVLLVSISQAFYAFFALASADLVDFSALTLAPMAVSKAFLEASSSASSDKMRALAIARASTVH
jgi:hypothetical protein